MIVKKREREKRNGAGALRVRSAVWVCDRRLVYVNDQFHRYHYLWPIVALAHVVIEEARLCNFAGHICTSLIIRTHTHNRVSAMARLRAVIRCVKSCIDKNPR